MSKNYDVFDWYWIVGGDGLQVYSSKLRDYVPTTDPAYLTFVADGTAATMIDTEHSLGGVMAVSNLLRPIPAGVLDGYTDALALRIAQQPDFVLWVELYQTVLALPDEAAVLAHIKTRL
ncbi:hypothetical protein JQ636_04680 [Bradyrhizobium japonicum]|uniref:hypothetical protein n=1 Tax=Bradyrhizobium japonicum TaxID=375 RepID=UPI001BAD4677|nr:hypothetical protein [Bradyrhizobium japonicum]MBR0802826.1 hypothetical protein [Bradyrhizobium japonicum]